MRILALIAVIVLIAAPAAAQNKYQSWSNPDDASIAAKLNRLIDEAEKSRAADPGFLRDLRALADSAAGPAGGAAQTTSKRPLFRDDFADGDFDRGPAWTVSSGRYWVEAGWGLRSSVSTGTTDAEPQKMKRKDKALALLGAVLNQQMGGRAGTTTTTNGAAKAAVIHSRVAIANAFRIEFGLSSWQPQGQFEIGPYQGAGPAGGYRLRYQPGGALSLVFASGRGDSVIAQASRPLALEDKKSHAVTWSRDRVGRMAVSIDGKTVLRATDRSVRDGFQGLSIGNRGGDYIIKSISVFDGG